MGGELRFEQWSLPTSGTFERKAESIPVESAEGRRELSAFSDCRCAIPDSWSKLSTMSTAPLIRVYDGTTVVDEFVAERQPRTLDFGETVPFSGPQLGQWGLSRVLVYPPDYGTNPSKRPNWKWGMENLIELDVSGLGNTNERWTFYLSGERYELDTSLATTGDFTLTVGGNTTSAIDYDADASAIKSALEALAGVTDVTVDQPDPDTREFFVVFEDPKDLASNMTANFTGTGGLGSLTKLSDGFDTGTSPTFSMTVDLQTTENIAWNASANTVEGSATGGTGLQGLSNVSDVAVSGSGTYDDPYDITFINPPRISNFGVTFSAGTAVVTRVVNGGYSADPVTVSKPIDEGTGPEEVHGSYGDPALEVVTDVVDTGADYSVLVRARSRFAGSQLVLNVEPGELYQASIRVRPAATSSYVLVVHDENQNQIARTADTQITADTWGTLSLSDILIPAGVERVIMRVAVVSNTTGNHYVNWQGAEFITGLAPTNPGDIVSTILDWSQTQGDGTWIDVTFDASTDTASTSWTQDYSYQADGFAMHLLHVLEDMRDLGYEFTLTPKSTPSGGLTHDLNLYMPEGAGTDRTTTGPALMTGGAIVGGQIVDRIPDFTVGVAWGADDLYVEDENATTKTTYGRLSRVFDVEQHANSDSLQDVLDSAFADEEANRQAASVTLFGSGNVTPFVDFGVGDTLVWQAGGRMSKNDRRVATITWRHRNDGPAEYEVQGSRIWGDPIAAIAEGLRRLMDAPKKRKRRGDRVGIDRDSTGEPVGAHIHLQRSATQSIGSGGAAISWDTEFAFIAKQNFAWSAGTDVTIQEPGYYNVDVGVKWAAAHDSPRVWVTRTRDAELTMWPPGTLETWTAPYRAQFFEGTAPAIPCLSGDVIKVYVDHGEGSAQNLAEANVAVYLVDRAPEDSNALPGPILWLKADAIETVADGGQVETWPDSSGNGNDAEQSTSSEQPTWHDDVTNGLPAVRFDGSDDYFDLPVGLLENATAGEIFAVLKVDNDPGTGFGGGLWRFGTAADSDHWTFTDGHGYLGFGSDTRYDTGDPSETLTVPHILNISSATDDWVCRVNASVHHSENSNTVAFLSAQNYIIGGSILVSHKYDGDMHEIIVYDRVLSTSERAVVHAYLAGKWGVTI